MLGSVCSFDSYSQIFKTIVSTISSRDYMVKLE